jgi:hypothetical protein
MAPASMVLIVEVTTKSTKELIHHYLMEKRVNENYALPYPAMAIILSTNNQIHLMRLCVQ